MKRAPVGQYPVKQHIIPGIVSDRTPAAVELLYAVKDRFGERHCRSSEPNQGCTRPAGHVCEVDIGNVQRRLHHIQKGCAKKKKQERLNRLGMNGKNVELTLCVGEPTVFF